MTEPAAKNRLPRTGTLVLIALVLLIGGGALMVWLPYHRNQRAMAEVEKLGGMTESEIVRPFWIPDAIDDEYLSVFERIDLVELSYTQTSDAGLKHVQGLSDLEYLWLDDTQVTSLGLGHLRGLNKLVELHLDNTRVNDAGLEHLRGLSNLENLWLAGTQVSDIGLEQLRGLIKLEVLWLDNTQVSDAGLEHLRGLTKLWNLSLRNTHVTQAGIDKLERALPDCEIVWTPPSE